MGETGQMDLFESLPGRRDDRAGWVQMDLFLAATEEAREARLKMQARPRMSITTPRQAPRQLPLVAAARFGCGVDDCKASFPTAGLRWGHVKRAHRAAIETEQEIRERIRARLSGSEGEGGEYRREGAIAS
jgi:hypothetical protein